MAAKGDEDDGKGRSGPPLIFSTLSTTMAPEGHPTAKNSASKLLEAAAHDFRNSLSSIRFLLFSTRTTVNKRLLADACNQMLNAILTDVRCVKVSLTEIQVSSVDYGLVRGIQTGVSSGSVWSLHKVLLIHFQLGSELRTIDEITKIRRHLAELKSFINNRISEWVVTATNEVGGTHVLARWNLWFAHVHTRTGDYGEAKAELQLATERDSRLLLSQSFSDTKAHLRNARHAPATREERERPADSFPLAPAPPKINEPQKYNFWIRCHQPTVFSQSQRYSRQSQKGNPVRRALFRSSGISIG